MIPGNLVAGWINRHQQAVIEFQAEEIKVLRELVPARRLRFTDAQRRRLALKAKTPSTSMLRELTALVTRTAETLVSEVRGREVRPRSPGGGGNDISSCGWSS